MSRAYFLSPLVDAPPGAHALTIARTGATLAAHVELAGDAERRRTGLLGRDGLAASHALVIAPCNAVHTFFMRFAIDVVFVDRAGVVLNVVRALRPWRIGISVRAFAAIELAAGAASDVQRGDRVLVGA
jgi:uncharacterized membrane protein (UPF0127 family)